MMEVVDRTGNIWIVMTSGRMMFGQDHQKRDSSLVFCLDTRMTVVYYNSSFELYHQEIGDRD